MGPGEHRPHDREYWIEPWSTTLFAGDLFEAIPFGDHPTGIYAGEEEPVAGRHFVGEVAFGYGLLITPTCDMTHQHGGGGLAHPYRVLVPVLPLRFVAEQTGAVAENEKLLRGRDIATRSIRICTFRRSAARRRPRRGERGVFLPTEPRQRRAARQPAAPGRAAAAGGQTASQGEARCVLARTAIDPNELPLHERDEDAVRASASPPSRYDSP